MSGSLPICLLLIHSLPLMRHIIEILLIFKVIQPCSKFLESFIIILKLRFFILTGNDNTCRIWVRRIAEYVVFTDCPPGPKNNMCLF